MYNNYFLRSFILPYLKSCKRLIARHRPNHRHHFWNNSRYYSTFWYYFCPSTDIYFKKKEKYQQHSKDLVDALKTWVDSIIFPYCEYVDGSLKVYDYSSTYDIPLLKQAKDHLDKRYPHILEMHNDTIEECTQLCRKIKEIIHAKDKPSFENIIITKINSDCPKLKMTHKNNLKEYSKEPNIYTDNDVFNIIFKNQVLDVNDLDAKEGKLLYQNFTNVAQGEKLDMEKLKKVILELISNNEIKKFIEEYHNIHKELENKSESFKKEIRELYNLVNGGKQLDKPKDCDICKSF